MSTPQTINLASFLARIDLAVKRESDAEEALAQARQNTVTVRHDEKQKALACLKRGETTGNPLKDEMLRHLGLDMPKIEAVIAFSDHLVKAAGQYLILCLTYPVCHRHVMIPTPGHGNESHEEATFLLGELSGEPLKASGTTELGNTETPALVLLLPVKSFVKWDTRTKPEKKETGPLVLSEEPLRLITTGRSFTAGALLHKIIHPTEQALHDFCYYIGDGQFGDVVKTIGSIRGVALLEEAKNTLDATPEDFSTQGGS